ncbi:carbohydrate ABC transporter permease [Clostridium beijerinckii]|uniref:Multiple sugar transport system permease protein n=1 Tax=Clostridium beijerinckii TaxID=1520 RepID=A0AAE5H3U9_CLOBE|nr:sugar ABC transporter permease [Clostridium beijerinckii]NRT35607.1 multiple sugar transport system permease protein [Clostridium beijerinckii]NRT44965.1 multiple sugar transport system permease protein [Clostridium beijerinckii]NRT72276.1 multiple sugar transport system permease protein [Clostridium beijerinckii]NRZ21040.1 multiple sugar transport system permease protein [Clostridium beijerinckii]NSB14357.1 multiple sugar transport system permease protein [Clostridium beijerinckii]
METEKNILTQTEHKFSLIENIRKNKFAYALILPAVIAMVIVQLIPMAEGLFFSVLKLNQFTLKEFLGAPFAGFDNFNKVLFDPTSNMRSGFLEALRNTGIYGIICSVLVIAIGLAAAMVVNREFKFRGIARTLLLTPWVVPSYVVGMLWGFMLQQDTGIINRILVDWLHILPSKPFWLTGGNVLAAIIIPTIWRNVPLVMIMLLAGLQNISDDYYEAAEIDGASEFQKFFNITLPLLKPVIGIQMLFGMINYIYSYNIVSMMFGHGSGYPGKWGDLLMTNIQRNSFQTWNFGTGAAATIVVMICMLIIVGIWYRVFRDSLVVDE